MTQKTNSRVVIDTNRHGIRRETNLDQLAKKAQKKKTWQKDPYWKKNKKKDSTKLNEVKQSLSTDNLI